MKLIAHIFSRHTAGIFFTDLFLCSTFQAHHKPPWAFRGAKKEECPCFLYPLANLILLLPFFKPKVQLDTTQLRCCYPRNHLGKLGLYFSPAGSTFCASWTYCLCADPSWKQEQPSSERDVWLMLYRNKYGCVMLGWRIRCSASILPVNQLCSLVGALPLMGFRPSLMSEALLLSTSMWRRNHIPFLSRGMSWLHLGPAKALDTGRRRRSWVVQGLPSWLLNSAVLARDKAGPGHLLLQLWQRQHEPIKSLACWAGM